MQQVKIHEITKYYYNCNNRIIISVYIIFTIKHCHPSVIIVTVPMKTEQVLLLPKSGEAGRQQGGLAPSTF